MKRCAAIGVVVSLGAGLAVASGTAPAASQVEEASTQTYIVVLDEGVDAGGRAAEAAREHGAVPEAVYRYALTGYAATMTTEAASQVAAEPGVDYVVPGRRFRAPADPEGIVPCGPPGPTCQAVARGINRIAATTSSAASGDGLGRVPVNVAVLDSGVARHSDLDVVGGVNCMGDGLGARVDVNGHGTMVAGIIGAKDNGQWLVGVAPRARISSVRVLDENLEADESQILCGIDWVTSTRRDASRMNNIRIANLSLGAEGADDGNCGRTNQDPLHRAICRSVAHGVTYVAAAGNDAADLDDRVPAAYAEVLTVTAVADTDGAPGGLTPNPTNTLCGTGDDIPADFSNFASGGAHDDHLVAGPGKCIGSLWPDGTIAVWEGTSFAAPFVAGTVALCREFGPCAGHRPAWIIDRILSDAHAYNLEDPAYGFEGDPQRPIDGHDYGPLIRADVY